MPSLLAPSLGITSLGLGAPTILGAGATKGATSLATSILGGGLTKAIGAALPWVGLGLTAAQLLAPLIGRGRKQADIFVQGVQNPISDKLKGLYLGANTAIQAGNLTYDQAQQTLSAFDTQAGEFETAAQQFEGLGSKQKTVVQQARATVNPVYSGWRSDLAHYVDLLKPVDTPEPTPPSETPPTLPTNAPQLATGAAAQQKKRVAAAYGRSSTILTGAGLGALSQANRRTATILGY